MVYKFSDWDFRGLESLHLLGSLLFCEDMTELAYWRIRHKEQSRICPCTAGDNRTCGKAYPRFSGPPS